MLLLHGILWFHLDERRGTLCHYCRLVAVFHSEEYPGHLPIQTLKPWLQGAFRPQGLYRMAFLNLAKKEPYRDNDKPQKYVNFTRIKITWMLTNES